MRQIALDTETTGLETSKGHRIIEIACVELIERKLTGNHFHVYCNPERDIDVGAMQVHGIQRAFLQDKPIFASIIGDLIAFIDGAELIIHNAPFDIGFMEHEFSLAKHKPAKIQHYCQILDTLILARQMHPGQRNSLDALCKRYHVDNSTRDLHGALLDAELLAQVYLRMTGGQGTLFGEKEDHHATQTNSSEQPLAQPTQATQQHVLYATQEELLLHQNYLEKITEDTGEQCLWLQQTEK